MSDVDLAPRLAALESRLGRLETILGTLADKLDRGAAVDLADAKAGIQAWVTEYVSLRLQQLVPETCEHAPDETVAQGPVLPGTRGRCTAGVPRRPRRSREGGGPPPPRPDPDPVRPSDGHPEGGRDGACRARDRRRRRVLRARG